MIRKIEVEKLISVVVTLLAVGLSPAFAQECEKYDPQAPIDIGQKTVTSEQFAKALDQANMALQSWLTDRSRGLKEQLILGPALDGAYYYRLAGISAKNIEQMTDERNLRYYNEVNIDNRGIDVIEERRALLQEGFPRMQPNELFLVASANLRARQVARLSQGLGANMCVKHFPGGNEMIEMTEEKDVVFNNTQLIQNFLQPFRQAISGSIVPKCVMLAHARYNHEAFNHDKDVFLGPWIGRFPFKDIPASLNPAIVRYLRENLKFAGVTMADWLDMRAVSQFFWNLPGFMKEVEKSSSGPRGPLILDAKLLYILTYADVDFIPGLHCGTDENARNLVHELKRVSGPYFNEWQHKLDQNILATLTRLGVPVPMEVIAGWPTEVKIQAKCRYQGYDEKYKQIVPQKVRETLEPFKRISSSDNDIWNRSGVMTLLQRMYLQEALAHPDLPVDKIRMLVIAPKSTEVEIKWFYNIVKPENRMSFLRSVPWHSQVISALMCEAYKRAQLRQ